MYQYEGFLNGRIMEDHLEMVVKVGLSKKQELDGEFMGLVGELIGGFHGDLL